MQTHETQISMDYAIALSLQEDITPQDFVEMKKTSYNLHVKRYSKRVVPSVCLICTRPFKPNQCIVALACFHTFHEKELKEWLTINPSCPICKAQV